MTNELVTYDFGEDAGAGVDDIDAGSGRLPRLSVLQVNSQQCLRRGDKYVQGAEPGLIFNSETNELYETLQMQLVHTEHQFIAWPPTDGSGGGFPRYFYGPGHPHVRAALAQSGGRTYKLPYRDPITGDDLELVDTQTAYVLFGSPTLTEANAQRAQIPFSTSNLQVFDQWIAALRSIRMAEKVPPIFFPRWELSSQIKSNRAGQQWFVFAVKRVEEQAAPGTPLYEMAKEFRNMCLAGPFGQDQAPAPESRQVEGPRASRQAQEIDDEIPF